MKYDEYVQMKNFSEQQNFAMPDFLKKAGTTVWDYLKKVPGKAKELGGKAWNPGAKDFQVAATSKATTLPAKQAEVHEVTKGMMEGRNTTADLKAASERLANEEKSIEDLIKSGEHKNLAARAGIIGSGLTALGAGAKKIWGKKTLDGAEGLFQKLGGKFTNGKTSLLTTGKTAAENQAALGKKIAAGAAGGTALAGGTVYALASSGSMSPNKYYIFDDQSGKVLGSSNGYASKAEALADRNARFQGGRINLGSTLAAKMSA